MAVIIVDVPQSDPMHTISSVTTVFPIQDIAYS